MKTSPLRPRWTLKWITTTTLILFAVSHSSVAVEKATPLSTVTNLPIKELTVFKDGHALVAQEGEMPTDAHGNVVLDYLPTPVLGAFWPYCATPEARLTGVVAGQRRVLVERTALSLRELLEANIGAQAIISEGGKDYYEATILGLPLRSGEELEAASPPNTPERLPERGNLILLETWQGVKAVSIDRIQEVTFKGDYKPRAANEEFRNLLTLRLNWSQAPARNAKVGLFYLQKGVRWIPEYKVDIDGEGKAVVKFQATLLNELADLEDVSVNLVIGVPTFAFKDNIDPIALNQTVGQLSQYFQTPASGINSPIAAQFSNAIMTQSMHPGPVVPYTPGEGAPGWLGPEIGETTRSEDLFVFNVQHVTLRKGERMALPVAEFTIPYKDIFTLDLPFGPPPEVRGNISGEQQRELARLLGSPKVMHKLRLTNDSKYPFTTAPALIVRGAGVLAQGLMTYTPKGAQVDLPITTAVDFQVKKSDRETKRTPNAVQENGNSYSRVDLTGKITLTSHHPGRTELEITRYVLGAADSADHDAKLVKVSMFEDGEFLSSGEYPSWWSWYGWPYWWNYFNGIGRITWNVEMSPDETLNLTYDWHYFWR